MNRKTFEETYWKIKLLQDKLLEETVHKVGQKDKQMENRKENFFLIFEGQPRTFNIQLTGVPHKGKKIIKVII